MNRTVAALLISTAACLAATQGLAQQTQGAPTGQAPAAGQPAGQASAFEEIMTREYSQESLDLAAQLVKLSNSGRVFDEVLPNLADQAKNEFIRANPQMQLGIIEVVDRVALSLVGLRPQLDQMLARVWASGFTNEEMQGLIEFYSSDVGKKFAELHPRLLAVQMATAQVWGRAVLQELTKRVQAELRATMALEQRSLQGDTAGPAPAGPAAQPEAESAPDLGGALAPVQ